MKHTYVVAISTETVRARAGTYILKEEDAFLVEAASKAEAISTFTKLAKGRFGFRDDLTVGLVKEDTRAGNLIVRRVKMLTKEKQA